MLTKSIGTQNPINLVKATMDGLIRLRRPEEVAELRGLTVSQVLGIERDRADGTEARRELGRGPDRVSRGACAAGSHRPRRRLTRPQAVPALRGSHPQEETAEAPAEEAEAPAAEGELVSVVKIKQVRSANGTNPSSESHA